jgi:hypothetical protein
MELFAKRELSPALASRYFQNGGEGTAVKSVVSPEKSGLVSRGERDAPKFPGILILLDKLDGVGGHPVSCEQLRNHPRRNLDAAVVLHGNQRTDLQVSIQLHGGPIFVQVGRFGRHRKGSFVSIFARQSYRAMECNPSAPPLSQLNAT